MKISHCISSIDKNAGGTTTACVDLLKSQHEKLELELYTLNSSNPIEISLKNLIFFSENPSFLDYSISFGKHLVKSDSNLFHGHGLWNLPIHQMASIARKKRIPYIISTHGMLEPWSLEQSKFKKNIAMKIYQHKDLKDAACLHATGIMEMESIRKLGYKNPIADIPNGININDFPKKQYIISKRKKTILFLSRIHPKKGIEILINAWQLVNTSTKENWCVKIAGNGDEDYINQLNTLINDKGLTESITIVGPKFGEEKITSYHEADLFVLPTYSENFGIVIAEALCCGVPVITTKGTPWEILETYSAGKWIDIGETSFKEALESFMSKTEVELQEIGENGRKLIIEKYSIESVAERFVLLYQWILTGKNKPDFIYV
jgi:glycosyltransferase involved in cell wall biosynthesis